MFRTGLVSVSFRSRTPRQVLDLAIQAQLEGIEWGGDIHVPPSDTASAKRVGLMTREAGLAVVCYGSYYRCDSDAEVKFEDVLNAARHLETPTIRVWAGRKGSVAATKADYAQVRAELVRLADMAAPHGITIATEYHSGTLTDTQESCARLHAGLDRANLKTLWQPLCRSVGNDEVASNVRTLQAVLDNLQHVHVYEWKATEGKQRPASLSGSEQWPHYLRTLQSRAKDCWLLLEFLPEESLESLQQEAAALRDLAVQK